MDFVYKAGSAEDTLKDIDIHIKSGETVGVIGGTGCGKSTFVNLISRLYDVKPDGGSSVSEDMTCVITIWRSSETRWRLCSRRMCCSQARYSTT